MSETTTVIVDEHTVYQQLLVVEKYERFINYLYPILQNCPRKHGVVRDAVFTAMFSQVDLFINAGKSKQPSRLYSADANLAFLRFWLRFLASPGCKLITKQQERVALSHLAEVGRMTGSWIKSQKRGG